MKAPEVPANEEQRLADLHSCDILDTGPDPVLDRLTELATEILGVPMALVSIVDAKRQWFKSRQGLQAVETPRDVSFCGHVVADGAALVVNDALTDPRFADNPLVAGEPNIRFYAGVPLRTPRGYDLGTFCVIDREPRSLSATQHRTLVSLAELALVRLESLAKSSIMQRVVDAAPGMLAYWDSGQRCRFANAAYDRWFGVRADELVGRTLADLLGPIYRLNRPYIEAALRGEEQLFEREIPDPAGGPARYSQAHYVPHVVGDKVHGFAVMVVDITARKQMEQELEQARLHAEQLARHDTLTGLPNRANVAEQLERLVSYAKRYKRQFALMYLDLDGFKGVNDTLGHAAGDTVLKAVAHRLLGSLRTSDTIARLGGDEFVVVLPEIRDVADALRVAEKLVGLLETPPIEVSGRTAGITLSIGIATFPASGSTVAQLFESADAALYEAKRHGKNRVELHASLQPK